MTTKKKGVTYKDYKMMKAEQAQKAYEKIKGPWTLLGYIIGYKAKEALFIGFIVILTLYVLQNLGFDFTIFKIFKGK